MARVLVVDDEPSIVYLFKEFFKLKGFEVDTAGGGIEALKKIHNNTYHLMLLDIKMGQKHGLEVLENIIEHDYDFPVIICTAYKHLKQDVELISRGRMDVEFIAKPPDLEDLWEKASRLLKKHAIKTEAKPDSKA